MPLPLSFTLSSAVPPSRRRLRMTAPPGGVNLVALASRLPMICSSRARSPTTQIGWSAMSIVNVCPFRSNKNAPVSPASRTTSDKCSSSRSSRILPLVIRPTSSRRSEEHTSELQSLMRISYAVFFLKKKKTQKIIITASKIYLKYIVIEQQEHEPIKTNKLNKKKMNVDTLPMTNHTNNQDKCKHV